MIQQACEWRLYPALILYSQNMLKTLDGAPLNSPDHLKSLHKIIDDLLIKANLLALSYWQLGLVQAGIILTQAANLLAKKILFYQDKNQDTAELEVESILHRAIKYFLFSKIIKDKETSILIIKNMSFNPETQNTLENKIYSNSEYEQWVSEDVLIALNTDVNDMQKNVMNSAKRKFKPLTPSHLFPDFTLAEIMEINNKLLY